MKVVCNLCGRAIAHVDGDTVSVQISAQEIARAWGALNAEENDHGDDMTGGWDTVELDDITGATCKTHGWRSLDPSAMRTGIAAGKKTIRA